jgi:hypothetical protein
MDHLHTVAMSLKPITVILKETRHKSQPWTFTIDRPGPQRGETKLERYASKRSAKRGAARKLVAGAFQSWDGLLKAGCLWHDPSGSCRPVKFIVQRLRDLWPKR